MASRVETLIRGAVTAGADQLASFNRARPHRVPGGEPNPYLTGLHAPMSEEVTLANLPVSGEIPRELDGRYLRIGPNPAGPVNASRYHWFTGDGMVHGIRIQDGRALWYRNRWVRAAATSRKLNEPQIPGPVRADFAVNTNVIGHAHRTFALVEAGPAPIELSDTLDSRRYEDFSGTLHGAFSAHPHRDPLTGELHAVCYDGRIQDAVHHVVVDAAGQVIRREPIPVKHGPSIHDCALTGRYVLVLDLPVTFSLAAYTAGWSFPYRWNAQHQARVGLLQRQGSASDIIWCAVDPCYVYHPCNAYDRPDGTVVMDVVVHDRNGHRDYRGPDADAIAFERWVIDPATHSVSRTVLDDTAQEFPRCHENLTGQPYRYGYCLRVPTAAEASAGLIGETSIIKHDLHTGARTVHEFGAGRFPGEFVYIPREGASAEDDGYLMGLVVDLQADTTDLAILSASDASAPPLARITLPHRVPPGFHGNWVPEHA